MCADPQELARLLPTCMRTPEMFRSTLAVTAAVLLSLPGISYAAKVKVWHHHTPAHHDKAQLKQAVVSNEGALRLSRHLRPLVALDTLHVWSVVEDRAGNLLVATGDEGKLYKVTPDGKVSTLYASEDSQILCLALTPDGTLFAGTGPGGTIVRITPDGKASVLHRSPETYVWCLAYDARQQTLYAGTGPKGRIYRVTPDGKASVFYATKQDHILCLGQGPDGLLYAGTDKGGLVYRIDARGKGFVLFSAPQAEIRSLLVTGDSVYAATSAPTRRRGSAAGSNSVTRSTSSTSGSGAVPVSNSGTKGGNEGDKPKGDGPKGETSSSRGTGESSTAPPSEPAESSESKKSSSTLAPAPPSTGENSLYRIGADGTVREVFREKALLLSLLRREGRIFIGSGMDGQLFEVEEASKERCEVARLDHGQIHCLCRRRDGSVVLGTGDPGKLYVLQEKYAPRGTVVSEVLDARLLSRWGSLRWKADTPPGTRVTVAVRSGNVAEPDETWSDWSAEQTDAQQAVVAAPPARFLQYRVTLGTDNPAVTPALHDLALRYMTTNQAPEVTEVEVPNLDAVNLDNPKKLKLRWNATDPNEDDLAYSLFVRKEGWSGWVELETDLEKKEFTWDTTTTPSGTYRVKVVASDRKDNPEDEALKAERISAPLMVSHTPPTVTLQVVEIAADRAVVEATAVDPLVRLTEASFAINGKKWVNVFPTDTLFDSKRETFRFETETLKPGSYVLVLRVRDAAGNLGSNDIVFRIPGPAAARR